MYIGPHTCMSGYVSAYHGVGKLCILLHTILCHAVYSITYTHCQTYSSTPYKYKLEIIIPLIDIGLGGSRGQLDLNKEVHMLITKGHCTIWVLSHRLLPYRVF